MKPIDGRIIILVAFVLVLLGAVLPFLMVMQVLKASFPLAFISYAASTGGLILGVVGAAMYVRERRR